MKLKVRMVLLIAGIVVIVGGISLIYLPAGIISLGISLVILGFITVSPSKLSKVDWQPFKASWSVLMPGGKYM